jgi:hypothetical protein
MREERSAELVDAVRCWCGWGTSAMPRRDDSRLVNRFGEERGAELLREILALEDEFYQSDARLVAANIQDMARRCADDFKRRKPDVATEIVDAFVWCYTFDYK